MHDTHDSSRKVAIGSIGGDFNASSQALNLGEISGAITNFINQLPSSPTSEQPGIKELLSQLKDAIDASSELTPEDKKDALEAVKTLAEIGQNPQQPEKESIGRKAIKILKGTLASLPETTKIVEASAKLLPLISKFLGLPI